MDNRHRAEATIVARAVDATVKSRVSEADRVPPLVARIASELSDGILAGRYRPGDRLREQVIADHFQVSRAPVREAIRLLEIDGLIVTQPWRGARVVHLTIDEMDDLFETLGALLGLVAKLAARHGSRADSRRFRKAVDAMHRAQADALAPVERLKRAFEAGKVLREMCGSSRAGDMLLRTSRVAFLNHQLVQEAGDAWQLAALALWDPLVTAIEDRDADRAEAQGRAIIKHTQDFTMPRLRNGSMSLPGNPADARVSARSGPARQPTPRAARGSWGI